MKQLKINKLQNSEIDKVADILTCAFISNPAYSIIFTDKNQLKNGLFWLFKTNLFILNQQQKLTNVIKEKDTEEIIGTYTLIPPCGIKTSILSYLRVNIPGFIFRFGINSLFRMLSLDKINKKTLLESMKTSEYYYLSMVAIKKEYRGKGVGSYVIQNAIQELISSKPDCNLLGLTTQLPENETFYSRLGFVTLDKGYIYFKKDKYYNYNMKFNLTCFAYETKKNLS